MNAFRAFLGGLLYGVNRVLLVLILAHFIQGAFMAYRAYVTGDLSLIGVVAFCTAVVFVCAWRIYRTVKQSRELREVLSENKL